MADPIDHAHRIVEETAKQRLLIVAADLDVALMSLDVARTAMVAEVRERNIQNALKVKEALETRLVSIDRERQAVASSLAKLEDRLKAVHEVP